MDWSGFKFWTFCLFWRDFNSFVKNNIDSYQFDDIYESTKADPYSRAFTMFLLVCLVIWGSLVMVNLLVAIIVSDISQVTILATEFFAYCYVNPAIAIAI